MAVSDRNPNFGKLDVNKQRAPCQARSRFSGARMTVVLCVSVDIYKAENSRMNFHGFWCWGISRKFSQPF